MQCLWTRWSRVQIPKSAEWWHHRAPEQDPSPPCLTLLSLKNVCCFRYTVCWINVSPVWHQYEAQWIRTLWWWSEGHWFKSRIRQCDVTSGPLTWMAPETCCCVCLINKMWAKTGWHQNDAYECKNIYGPHSGESIREYLAGDQRWPQQFPN